LVPKECTVGEFSYLLRNQLFTQKESHKALFLYIINSDTLPLNNEKVGDLHVRYQQDQILRIQYEVEHVFG